MPRWVWLVLLLLLVLPQTAAAQEAVTMTVDQVGYDETGAVRQWVPIVVTLSNTGSDINGVLSVVDDFGQRYTVSQPVELPGGGKKQVTLSYPVATPNPQLDITFTFEQRRINQSVALHAEASTTDQNMDSLILAFGGAETALIGTDFVGTSVEVKAGLPLEQVPSTDAGLYGVAVIALSNADGLLPEQAAALRRWVGAGGILLLDGGPSSVGLPSELDDITAATITAAAPLPVEVDSPNPLQQPTQPARALEVREDSTVILTDKQTQPLIAKRQYGQGWVLTSAIDLVGLNPQGNADSPWNTLIPEPKVDFAMPSLDWFGMQRRDETLPSPWILVFLLLVYILVIGPVNYLVLRRLDRRELAWFTIPITVLVTTAIFYVSGFSLRGTNLTTSQISLVEAPAGASDGRLIGSFYAQAGRRSTWSIEFPNTLAAGPIGNDFNQPPDFQQTNDLRWSLPALNLNSGERRGVGVVGVVPIPYQMSIQFDSTAKVAEITNIGSTTIPQSYFYSGNLAGDVVILDALAPGESRTIDVTQVNQQLPFLPDLNESEGQQLQTLLYDRNQFTLNTLAMDPSLLIIERTPPFQPLVAGEPNTPTSLTVYMLYAEER